MNDLWLKIKVWTKVTVFALLFIYVAIFIAKNSERPVKPWFWIGHEPNTTVLPLILWAFGTGVVGTILVRTTFKTMRQIREIKERGRHERLHRDVADIKTKAAMLRSRPGVLEADEHDVAP